MAGARLVVSLRGDILSPKYAPERIAPAVIPTRNTQGIGNTNKGNTYSSRSGPAASRSYRNHRTNDHCGCQEILLGSEFVIRNRSWWG